MSLISKYRPKRRYVYHLSWIYAGSRSRGLLIGLLSCWRLPCCCRQPRFDDGMTKDEYDDMVTNHMIYKNGTSTGDSKAPGQSVAPSPSSKTIVIEISPGHFVDTGIPIDQLVNSTTINANVTYLPTSNGWSAVLKRKVSSNIKQDGVSNLETMKIRVYREYFEWKGSAGQEKGRADINCKEFEG